MRISIAAPRLLIAAAGASFVLSLTAAAPAQDAPAAKKPAPAAPAPAQTAPAPAADPTAPPPDAPMDPVMPKNMRMPSEGWTDADKSADNAKKATEALVAVQKAYQAPATMTDRADMTTHMPDGESKDSIDMAFGKGNDLALKMGSMQIIASGDTAYFIPDQPADKYLFRKIDGSLSSTLEQMLPGFSLPAPNLALRQPAAGATPADAFAMGAVKGLQPVGYREKGGMQEVLLAGGGAEAAVVIDPGTRFVKSYSMVFTPEGLPPAIKLGVDIGLHTSTDAPKTPIAFAAGNRKGVGSIEELLDQPAATPGEGGEGSVKVGADAPLAVLTSLDGKTVDLTAMKGKVIVLDFWATWCGPCRKGLPLLQEFADSMKGNDKVVIYPVNVWEQSKGEELTKKVEEFWTKQKFTMTTLLDPEAALIGKYGFQGIPAFVIVGPDGKLAATHLGYDPKLVETLKAEVQKALDSAH